MREYRLSPSEYFATVEKVQKANDRAAKKGFTGKIEFVGEPKEIQVPNGWIGTVTEVVYDCQLIGEPAHYDGWIFAATLDWDQHAGLIVRNAPGAAPIDRENVRENECDHCGVKRYRKATYVVTNSETGEQLQVGSTCMKDFLPSGIIPVFIDDSVVSDDENFGSYGGYRESSYSVESVMEVAWAVIKHFGWVPSSGGYDGENYKTPTRQIVHDVFSPPKRDKYNAEYLAKLEGLKEYAPQMAGKGAEVKAFILSDEFSGDSDYVVNLKNLMSAEFVSAKNLGFIVSAPQAMMKAQAKSLIQKTEKVESNWIGNVGDKVSVKVHLLAFPKEVGYQYTSYLHRMVDANGNIIVWFASRMQDFDLTTEFTITGTIKKCDEFNGVKQTILTRCKTS